MSQVLIAIVDDDETMRAATKTLVRALGYNISTFGSADEFLKSEQVHDTSCLITDVQMPGLSGRAWAARIVCGNFAGGGTVESTLLFHRCPPAEQVGQLRDVGGDAPGLIAVDQSGISDSALVGALGAGASCAGRGRGIGNAAAPRW